MAKVISNGLECARCQKHSTKPQALHLARILNPLTTALRFVFMDKQLSVLAVWYVLPGVRASVLDNFMMAMNNAKQRSFLMS
jgi:hypothetical protein